MAMVERSEGREMLVVEGRLVYKRKKNEAIATRRARIEGVVVVGEENKEAID